MRPWARVAACPQLMSLLFGGQRHRGHRVLLQLFAHARGVCAIYPRYRLAWSKSRGAPRRKSLVEASWRA